MSSNRTDLPERDRMLLQRHLDGELDGAASTAFAARLAAEPSLARAAAAERALRGVLATARGDVRRAPPSFAANVVAAARRLPTRQQLEQADVAAGAVSLCRRLLLAAAIVAGLGLVWHSGLVHLGQPQPLQAAPGDVKREMDRLDALPAPAVESQRGK
jgi:anti-sigma factor RsiW